jgi:hypothetical protein
VQNVDWIIELSRILAIILAVIGIMRFFMSGITRRISSLEKENKNTKRSVADCLQLMEKCPMHGSISNLHDVLTGIKDDLKDLRIEFRKDLKDIRLDLKKHVDYHMRRRSSDDGYG